MATSSAADVTELIHALVAAPVRTQLLMDAHWSDEVARWRAIVDYFIANAPDARRAEIAACLVPTAPLRQVLDRYELDCAVEIRVERTRGFAIGLEPLDIGWEIIRGETRESTSRVVVEVDTVPLPEPARAPQGVENRKDWTWLEAD